MVVFSLVLCSVRRPALAFAEAVRVLRPGGSVLMYEHVRSQRPVVAALERLVTPLWSRFAAGCHLDRDPMTTAVAAGLVAEDARRFGFSPGPGLPAVSHVMARLRRSLVVTATARCPQVRCGAVLLSVVASRFVT